MDAILTGRNIVLPALCSHVMCWGLGLTGSRVKGKVGVQGSDPRWKPVAIRDTSVEDKVI
jgi:hypothetical protein